jgi:plastocyanin
VPVIESKTYKITIKNNAFIPDNLKIEKGSIVEWRVISDASDFSHNSLYDSGSRKHVISFDSIQTESPILKKNDFFRVRFLEVGSFKYKC